MIPARQGSSRTGACPWQIQKGREFSLEFSDLQVVSHRQGLAMHTTLSVREGYVLGLLLYCIHGVVRFCCTAAANQIWVSILC